MVSRYAEDGGENGAANAHRISNSHRSLQKNEDVPVRMGAGIHAGGEGPATRGASSCRVSGPQRRGEILPPRGPSDVAETGADGLPTIHRVLEIHPETRDGGGAEGAAREAGSSHGRTGCCRARRVQGDGRGAGTTGNNGTRNKAAGLSIRKEHLRDWEKQLISTLIAGTSHTAVSSDVMAEILDTCQQVVKMKQFQKLEMITLCGNEDFEELVDALLTNCIESASHPNARERAIAAICYFLKIYRETSLTDSQKEHLFMVFNRGLQKYNLPWTLTRAKNSYMSILTRKVLSFCFQMCKIDLNILREL